jgi:hypothetical protein
MNVDAMSSEPLARETESQTQITKLQTQIAKSQTHITLSKVVSLSMQCIMSQLYNSHKISIIYNATLVYKIPNHHVPSHNSFELHISYTYFNIIIISRYSKVLKSSKTDIFNIQLIHIYKTYIFYKSIIHKSNSFSVSRILTLAALDSRLKLNIEEPLKSPIMTRLCKYLQR